MIRGRTGSHKRMRGTQFIGKGTRAGYSTEGGIFENSGMIGEAFPCPSFYHEALNCRHESLGFGSFHVKWTKFQKSSHLTLMDFAEILSSQCTHQEMKILKILLSSRERFQNYSHLNYELFNLDIESLQFVAFWNAPIYKVLTVNIWNFK